MTAARVSVCLPVYNGQDYLRLTIDSVLGQTYRDFELAISDNASTDGTAAICREAAARDPRVRYVRHATNEGLAWNFNHALALTRGEYVMWVAHDDLMMPDYIEKCVDALERDRALVIAFSYQDRIDEHGHRLHRLELDNIGEAPRASERFRELIKMSHPCAPIFGLMRRAALAHTRLHGGYADSDRVLLAEMGLLGPFSLVREYLFAARVHARATTLQYVDLRERSAVFDTAKAGRIGFPFILKARDFWTAVSRAPLSTMERLRCYRHLLRWARKQWFELRFDFREGMVMHLKRRLPAAHFVRLRAVKRALLG